MIGPPPYTTMREEHRRRHSSGCLSQVGAGGLTGRGRIGVREGNPSKMKNSPWDRRRTALADFPSLVPNRQGFGESNGALAEDENAETGALHRGCVKLCVKNL